MIIRPAVIEDHADYLPLFAELGVDDPPPSRERFAREIAPDTFVAEEDGRVVGYAYAQRLRDLAYVRNVAVAPSARRAGVGRRLLEAVAVRARAAGGASAWCLNVMPDNVAAIALYEALGLRQVYTSTGLWLTWEQLGAMPGGGGGEGSQPPSIVELAGAAEDDALERSAGLPAGLLADARTRGRLVACLRLPGEAGAAGLAVVEPELPACFPCRVVEPSFARALLEGVRAYVRPGASRLLVAVEDDPAFEAALVSVGGEVRLRTVHMRGPL